MILRIAQALQKREACRVLCSSITEEIKMMFEKSNVQINILPKWEEKILAHIINSEKAMFYSPRDFILTSEVLQSEGILNNCFLYVVHFNNMSIQSKKLSFLNNRLNKEAKYLFDIFERTGHVIFMDDMCANYYKKFYEYTDDKSLKIIRLPLEEPEIIHKQERNDNVINILSVARAEFPFKGYLVGLINELQNSKFTANIILTIITYGKGFLKLKELAERKTGNDNVIIRVLEKVDYDQLNSYYQNSDLYIGMGTTIIEAASNGSVSIPVLPYTYELVSDKYFFEKPQCIALEKIGDTSTMELINRYINASKKEQLEMKRKSYQAFKDNYSMSVFLEKFTSLRFEQKEFRVSKITKIVLKIRMKH